MSTVTASTSAPSGAAHQNVTPYAWFVLGVLCFVYVLNFLDRQLLGTLTPFIEKDMGLSDAQIGNLGGLYFALFYTVIGVPIGWLADRYNRVRILSLGCFLWSLATGACGLSHTYGTLALSRMATGVGEAAGAPPSYSIVADYFPPHRRGMALAMFSLGVPLGSAGGIAFGVSVANTFGWRYAFMTLGVLGVIAALIVFTLVKEPKRGAKDDVVVKSAVLEEAPAEGLDPSRARFWPNLIEFFTRPVLLFTALGCGFSAMAAYGQLVFTTKLLLGKHMTAPEIALWYALSMAISGSLGLWLSGVVVDWASKRNRSYYSMVPALGLLVCAPIFFLFVHAQTWQEAMIWLTGVVFLNTIYLAPALAVVNNSVKPSQRTQASAMLLFVLNLVGLGGGPTMVGHLSTYFAPQVGKAEGLQYGLYALIPVMGLAIICMLVAAWAIKRETRMGTGGIRE